MSVATHYPDLEFVSAYRGYASGWSADEIQALGESLAPHAQVVAEQVTTRWVVEARCSMAATGVRQEDIVQPVMAEAGSEASVVPPATEPNVVPTIAESSAVVLTTAELPSSSSATPSTDTTGGPQ